MFGSALSHFADVNPVKEGPMVALSRCLGGVARWWTVSGVLTDLAVCARLSGNMDTNGAKDRACVLACTAVSVSESIACRTAGVNEKWLRRVSVSNVNTPK
jgi:hypothetical protein